MCCVSEHFTRGVPPARKFSRPFSIFREAVKFKTLTVFLRVARVKMSSSDEESRNSDLSFDPYVEGEDDDSEEKESTAPSDGDGKIDLITREGGVRIKDLLVKVGVRAPEADAIFVCSGVASCSDLADLKEEHIKEISRTVNNHNKYKKANITIGVAAVRKIEAMAWWFRDALRRGQDMVEEQAWNMVSYRSFLQQMEMEKGSKASGEISKSLLPGKIPVGKGWTQWSLSFKNYLSTILGGSGVPLSYVIRGIGDSKRAETKRTDSASLLIREAVLTGPIFMVDNRTVYQILKNCALSTPSWEWIRRLDSKENGRDAYRKLSAHYDGPGEVRKRLALAERQIKETHYRSEQTFSFESYVTKLKGAFEVAEECDQAYTEHKKVQVLLEGIQCTNADIHTVKMLIFQSDRLSKSFDKAANKLSEVVAARFPDPTHNKVGKRVAAVNQGKGKGGGKKPKTDGSIPSKVNGVDLTDIYKKFTFEEWNKIPYNVRDKIRAKREANPQKRKAKVSFAAKVDKDESDDEEKADAPAPTVGFGSKAYNKRKTSRVTSSARRIARSKVAYKGYVAPDDPVVGNLELDTHADTCCLGANFIPILYTGEVCSVQPFSDTYSPMEDVPVVTGVTAYDDENTGFTYLLEFNQCLWMGDQLDHSLINPNQVRSHGLSLCDDPYDPHRPLGVVLPDSGELLPFQIAGNIVLMKTRTPTSDELENCTNYIVMTSDAPWNPSEDLDPRVVSSVSPREPPFIEDLHSLSVLNTKRHTAILPEELCKKWKVGMETAKNTLAVTTQMGVRSALHPLRRRYRTDLLTLRYPRLKSTFYTDTIVSKYKALGGGRFAQVYTNGHFVRVFPLSLRSDVGETLQQFIQDVGVPAEIVYDSASEMRGHLTSFQEVAKYFKVKCRCTETDTPRQNKAESCIRELKAKWRQRMVQEGAPSRLWDYALVYEAELMSRTSVQGNRTGIEEVTGDTPDISEWLDFTFYDWVWFWTSGQGSMDVNPSLGKWLGVAHRVGSDMCFWILQGNGTVVARTTVQHVTRDDVEQEAIRDNMDRFKAQLFECLETTPSAHPSKAEPHVYYLEDIEVPEGTDLPIPEGEVPSPDAFDSNIGQEVLLPVRGSLMPGKVQKRLKDHEGNPIGVASDDALMDSRMYDVMFEDGSSDHVVANLISEGISNKLLLEGSEFILLEDISGHEFVPDEKGALQWRFYVLWKGGDASWVPLKLLRESYPVELADYLKAVGLDKDPSF